MSAEFFLDTNILVHTFDHEHADKRTSSRVGRDRPGKQCGRDQLSVRTGILERVHPQVCGTETPNAARDYLKVVLEPLCAVFPSMALCERPISLHERWRHGFYDSLIIGSALEAMCSVLYSEDLHDRQHVESLTIISPFIASGSA